MDPRPGRSGSTDWTGPRACGEDPTRSSAVTAPEVDPRTRGERPHATRHSPARTACLEESAATVLLLAARRLSVTWCHGVAPDPVRLHAWVETDDGVPVAEPPSTFGYTPALTIGGRHQQQ
ncbi:lasso peptide biosynthesis B2 protein [Streptomyces youssoufiensis]